MEKILVLDFGGQYDQLIARRVREQQVYAEIHSYNRITAEEIVKAGYKGIIFTGGPDHVYEEGAPSFAPAVLDTGIPILGICYGCQLLSHLAGGKVEKTDDAGEYGKTELYLCPDPSVRVREKTGGGKFRKELENHVKAGTSTSLLFRGIPEQSVCWMSHRDRITALPEGFLCSAQTSQCPYAGIEDPERNLYGVQFHPEVTHTEFGVQIIRNFLFAVCKCRPSWKMEDFLRLSVETLRKAYKDKKVLLALSGGVDSSVAAVLMHKAVGDDLTCVFVDHGLLRKEEGDFVEKTFRDKFGIPFIRINAEERFLKKLSGICEPEAKRKTIGEEFIRVFEDAAKEIGDVQVLCQGTIYPDIVESGKGDASVIKSHHNVGGLPSVIAFEEIVEPLKDLFKDEVRKLGLELGLPRELVYRQPFPGPGLAVRIIGEVTKEKLDILREADAIFREEVDKAFSAGLFSTGKYEKEKKTLRKGQDAARTEDAERRNGTCLPGQYFAALTDMRSVGVCGDARTYGYTVALRAVTTDDFMTAEFSRFPWEVLERSSVRITNELREITRVVYDITSKPPATVEYE